jgi:uncharacterized protein YodC (DUF2158 family)
MSPTFDLGNTVRLRSGGPVMTINEKAQGGGLVCVWFAGNEVKHHTFRPEALEAAMRAAGGALAEEDAITADE